MAGHALLFRYFDLQDGDTPDLATIWFDYWNPFEPAEVTGTDLVIPERAGMDPMTRVKLRRPIELRGFVKGEGNTAAERSSTFYAASEALRAIMDFDLAPGTLTWLSPYLGLPGGSQSIQARAADAIPGPITNRMSFQRWTFRLMAVGTPPEWVEDPT